MTEEELAGQCCWCEEPLDEDEGFDFEPEAGCVLLPGYYCSTECLISAA
jgi:hypothetical protein